MPPLLLLLLALPCLQALADAGREASQVANVEVVGGTTRVPMVLKQLTDLFGREPSRTLNSKETVSRGCALQCAMLSPTFKVRDFQVLDSFPYGVQFRCAGRQARQARQLRLGLGLRGPAVSRVVVGQCSGKQQRQMLRSDRLFPCKP